MPISKRFTETQLKNRKAVLMTDIRNHGGHALSKGTMVTITKVVRGKGLTIHAPMCPLCGQSTYITGVSREELTLTDQPTEELVTITLKQAMELLDTDPYQKLKEVSLFHPDNTCSMMLKPESLEEIIDMNAVKVCKIKPFIMPNGKSLTYIFHILNDLSCIPLQMKGTNLRNPCRNDLVALTTANGTKTYRLGFSYDAYERPVGIQLMGDVSEPNISFDDLTPEEKASIAKIT